MGLTNTSLVQVYVSVERTAEVLGGGGLRGLTEATAFGAPSSGCSFGAVAVVKGVFEKGAHAVNFLAVTFASTNLGVELDLRGLRLLGGEFLVAELLDGRILIPVTTVVVHHTLPEIHHTLPQNRFDGVREAPNECDRESGRCGGPSLGTEWKDQYTLGTDGGETRKFCSAGCLETYRQETSSRGGWREDLSSWGG